MTRRPLVLRFYPSEKLFHAINAVSWAFLITSGVIAEYKLAEPAVIAELMHWHIVAAIFFSLNVIGFLLLAPDRLLIMLQSLLSWDRNTFAWFRNLGGYPRKLLGISFGPQELAPQGRYNGGQKPIYLYLIASQWILLVTGWCNFLLVPAIAKSGVSLMHEIHVWTAISVSLLVVIIHIPLAFLNWEFFKAMWRIGPGTVPLDVAQKEMAQWVADDVMPTGPLSTNK